MIFHLSVDAAEGLLCLYNGIHITMHSIVVIDGAVWKSTNNKGTGMRCANWD